MTELASIQLADSIARAELELLANIACGFKTAIPISEQRSVTPRWFQEDDHRLIYAGLWLGHKERLSVSKTARITQLGLQSASLWDTKDERDFVTRSGRWGPGPLACLFCRMEFDVAGLASAVYRLRQLMEIGHAKT